MPALFPLLCDVLSELYEHGIEFGLKATAGHGLTAWVGPADQIKEEQSFTAEQSYRVAAWLEAAAHRHYAEQFKTVVRRQLAELAASPRKPPKRILTRTPKLDSRITQRIA